MAGASLSLDVLEPFEPFALRHSLASSASPGSAQYLGDDDSAKYSVF